MKGRMLNLEEIISLSEGCKVWVEDLKGFYENKINKVVKENGTTFLSPVNNYEEKYEGMWTITATDSDFTRINVYELIEYPNQYHGGEILSMIIENKLKEGQQLLGRYNDSDKFDNKFIIEKDTNNNLYLKEILSDTYKKEIGFWELTHITFTIKEKEYMTFDEARKTGTPKHKDENIGYAYGEFSANDFVREMDEKVWFIKG